MNDDMMNDKTTRSADPRFDRIGGDIERLSDTLHRIERNELDKKIGLDLLIGFAENLIEHAKALNKSPMFNRATLTDEEQETILEQLMAQRLYHEDEELVKRDKMTPKELNEYLAVVDKEVEQREEAERVDLALAASAAAVTNERLQGYIEDNSCCVTFDIDADLDSIVAQVRQSECAGGEIDEAAVVEFSEIISEPLDPGSLSAEEKSKKEARFLEGLFEKFISTAGDNSKGFSLLGRSSQVDGE